MDPREQELLEKYAKNDPELKDAWDDHLLYAQQTNKLEGKNFRTSTEEQTLKQLKKQKLEVKTRLIALLDKYALEK